MENAQPPDGDRASPSSELETDLAEVLLRHLVREGRLVKLGYGVYGRAVQSQLTGKAILYSQNGFSGAVRQALTKLGVDWEPTEAELDYNAGNSTQVPVNPVLRVKGRFSRQLHYGKSELILDR